MTDKPIAVKVPYDEIDPNDYETYSDYHSAKERARREEIEAHND